MAITFLGKDMATPKSISDLWACMQGVRPAGAAGGGGQRPAEEGRHLLPPFQVPHD